MDPSHGHTISSFSAKPDETPLSSRSALGPVHAFLQSKKEPSIRADCPDGRLSKIILHVVSSTSVSHMMVPLYKRFLELSRWNCKFFTSFFPPPGTRPSSGFPGTASGGGPHRHDPDRSPHKRPLSPIRPVPEPFPRDR